MLRAFLAAALCMSACASPRPAPPRPPPRHPELAPRLLVRFADRMGSSFRIEELRLSIDDQPAYSRSCAREDDACRESLRGPVVLHDGTLPEGTHELSAYLKYRGHGAGVFSYIQAYHFEVRSEHEAVCERGRRTVVDFAGYERGGPTTPLEQRPAIGWNGRLLDL